ncbi:MAG: histidine phosphatase family protein [Sneathiella sp.]|nr:histidine phosphatase family protein [Sneathiella sp.]
MDDDYVEKNWWLVRHMPVASKTIYGHLDLPAAFSDRRRLKELAGQLPGDGSFFSSDLIRCTETMRQILAVMAIDDPRCIELPRLREQSFGNWEGRTYSEIERDDPKMYKSFWEDPAASRPVGGESFNEMVIRVQGTLAELLSAHNDNNIVIVAHAGTIRAAVGMALDLEPQKMLSLSVSPLSLTRLTSFSKGVETNWQVSCVNDCGASRLPSRD